MDGIVYKHYYYLEKVENEWNPKVSFKRYSQVVEIECVKWVTLKDVQFLQLNAEYHKRMLTLFNIITKLFKKHTKTL